MLPQEKIGGILPCFFGFCWLQVVLPLAVSLLALPSSSHGLLIFLSLPQVSFCLSLISTFVVGFRTQVDNPA